MKNILLAIIALAWFLPSRGQELVVNFTYDTVCYTDITHFVSLCKVDPTAQPPDSIISLSWDLQGDGTFKDGHDSLNQYTYSAPGLHSVGIRILTKNGLAKALYKLVPVNAVTPLFTASTGCYQEAVKFSNKTLVLGDTAVTYFWRFGDGTTLLNVKNPIHFYPDSGTYVVTLFARFVIGCNDSVKRNVTVTPIPVPVVGFSRDTVMFSGDSLIASVLGTYDSVRWSTQDTNYSILITKAGYYSVNVYQGSCQGQSGFHVIVKEKGPEPVISNLFTPNGDGYNDFWKILNLVDFAPCQVNVFNRFGIQVLSSANYKNDWDGTYNGKPLANDTYYYFVRCVNQVLFKGNVNILK